VVKAGWRAKGAMNRQESYLTRAVADCGAFAEEMSADRLDRRPLLRTLMLTRNVCRSRLAKGLYHHRRGANAGGGEIIDHALGKWTRPGDVDVDQGEGQKPPDQLGGQRTLGI